MILSSGDVCVDWLERNMAHCNFEQFLPNTIILWNFRMGVVTLGYKTCMYTSEDSQALCASTLELHSNFKVMKVVLLTAATPIQ